MCDTFVVLGAASKDGKTIFGKNSDRPYEEVQNIVYIPKKIHEEDTVSCTYIEIPQVKETIGVLLCQPHWMWGAEMGTNDLGVVIGNEAVWTEEPIRNKGLLGMDLLRLGLERGKTAREAMNVIIDLLEKHGQGGNCAYNDQMTYHNSFLIADKNEAWVFETADKWWVAEHVIEGIRNISNELSIRKKFDLIREGTIEHAIEKGYCKDEDQFNFANSFAQGGVSDTISPFSREGRCQILLNDKRGKLNVEQAMEVLRDHEGGICMHGGFRSTASQVTKIFDDDSTINWLTGTPEPCMGMFKPIFLPNPRLPDNLESTLIPEREKLWWAHVSSIQKGSEKDLQNLKTAFRQAEINNIEKSDKLKFSSMSREKLNEMTLNIFKWEFEKYKELLN
ncbi:MAG: peptidase C69 [Candidatus Lokiarchaeota archaeon]|nr:peptidase C69 [Candidatus Lokiarchaeota archaeon]